MSKVICLGEIAVDWLRTTNGAQLKTRFLPLNKSASDYRYADDFHAEPGTPAANVALALSRLNVASSLIASIGNDEAGHWLKRCLESGGVDSKGMVAHATAPTCQAHVIIGAAGERSLVSITSGNCADLELNASAVRAAMFNGASVLYIGSNSLSRNPIARATKHAMAVARRKGMLLLADANIRMHLWESKAACKKAVLEHLRGVDVLKVNLDEFELLTGSRDFRKAKHLGLAMAVPVVIVTLGAAGAFFWAPTGSRLVPAVSVDVKDTAGAGDAFSATVISQLLSHAPKNEASWREALASVSKLAWGRIVERANAAGALTVSRFGAASALPSLKEVVDFIALNRKAG